MSARGAAARVLAQIMRDGRSVTDVLPPALAGLPETERGLAQELVFGSLRWLPRLDAILDALVQRPLRRRDIDVRALALTGLYQCMETRVPDHAAVSATVDAARRLRQPWAPGLVNAVLRRFLRERETVEQGLTTESARFAHPQWMIDCLRSDWPEHWPAITEANNARPPMTLRVNRRQSNRDAWLERLRAAGLHGQPHAWAADGVVLDEPVPVDRLPGFAEGAVSVQDAAGQLAAELLAPDPGHRVLDLCAAPGSKTTHILERYPELGELTAVDIDGTRLQRLQENLQRLNLSARMVTADATQPQQWWDGKPFDRILLDAPCSATGVIRRHPDIKLLRKRRDIEVLQALQETLLTAVWPALAPGGMLVYATCSMLQAENERVISRFLEAQPDASELPIDVEWGIARPHGRQILVGDSGMDGFYYAQLGKQ